MQNRDKYDAVAVTLHWVMAIAFFLMLGSGLSMEYLEIDKSFKFQMIQWHKSLGLLLLAAAVMRLIWRMISRPPMLPAVFKKMDKILAKAGHWALYAVMIAMPLSGWFMVSSSPYGLPTIIFGWFEWPHLPYVTGDKQINGLSREAHSILAWSFIVLIALHVAAVIKHMLFDRYNLLPRMSYRRKRK